MSFSTSSPDIEPTPSSSLSGRWFKKRESELPPPSLEGDGDDDDIAPVLPGEGEGQLSWALALGLIAGAIGGAGMVFAASEVARRAHLSTDVLKTIGATTRLFGSDPLVTSLVVGSVIGGLVGVIFGALMRYTLRARARLLSGIILAPVLWTLVHAFLLKSFAPSLGALPFGPMIAGAVVYGICIAIAKPPRRLVIIE